MQKVAQWKLAASTYSLRHIIITILWGKLVFMAGLPFKKHFKPLRQPI